ncbi:hypothetical protein HDU76_011706 [Blyttiomyces sp. JEL0837]|nr:hypothetical protein HDU76_011706 [Blyttiomyces sp. JEL0837]
MPGNGSSSKSMFDQRLAMKGNAAGASDAMASASKRHRTSSGQRQSINTNMDDTMPTAGPSKSNLGLSMKRAAGFHGLDDHGHTGVAGSDEGTDNDFHGFALMAKSKGHIGGNNRTSTGSRLSMNNIVGGDTFADINQSGGSDVDEVDFGKSAVNNTTRDIAIPKYMSHRHDMPDAANENLATRLGQKCETDFHRTAGAIIKEIETKINAKVDESKNLMQDVIQFDEDVINPILHSFAKKADELIQSRMSLIRKSKNQIERSQTNLISLNDALEKNVAALIKVRKNAEKTLADLNTNAKRDAHEAFESMAGSISEFKERAAKLAKVINLESAKRNMMSWLNM